jgi:hemerythrin
MDDQHGILLDTLNALRHQLARGNGSARLNEQLARLIEFTEMHLVAKRASCAGTNFPTLKNIVRNTRD